MNGLYRRTGCLGKVPWWKDATFYQVYPASFKDSNADGWGDIPGVISKIDYLHELGVDVIWLSPVFESPQADMGYDVSDYQKIYAPYGTVRDVDALMEACHARGMKLILDLVVNHTSIEHEWFKESRSSKVNLKRDWYIWKPARYDAAGQRIPPTNWQGYFAGPTWTWDEHTQEYYLHLYAPEQPDLNWESEACREAIYRNTMRFWLERGIDGFRIDTVNKYSKNTAYADVPITVPGSPYQPAPEMWCNGPRIHEFIHEMRSKVLDPYGAVSVGELSNTPHPSQVLPYVSAAAEELDMVFEFSVIRLGTGGLFGSKYTYVPFTLPELKATVSRWQTFIEGTDGWTTVFCENHDNGRAVSRFGDCSTPELWQASAKALALWQATSTGTLFLYQGQEIGMTNMPATWGIDEYRDVEGLNYYAEALASGDRKRETDTMDGLRILARDHSRTPFQWDDSANAGFTGEGVNPWMRVHDNHKAINAARQAGDPNSILSFYKRILRLRKQYKDLFVFGTFRLLEADDEAIFAYVKESCTGSGGGPNQVDGRDNAINGRGLKRVAVVVMNFSQQDRDCPDIRRSLDGSADGVASAPRPPELVPSEPASTGSLIDVDTPSVRTVPSDFSEQDIQTETQATRRELEGAAERARAEAHLAKKKGTGRVRRADSAAAKWFSELGNTATTALVVANLTAVVGLSGYVGYKAWGLYERGRVGWSNISLQGKEKAAVGRAGVDITLDPINRPDMF
ncbi:glycoside hydrolase family 13 protein [Durotheca rogersii]|uniref:glycoside hydrolase family 13 protein n=1 Tax=Durotheca rogersii TaxID=419775 RepID=UPI002220DF1D|nr:glycoside hydrolase family 13 protein [Durotheca rogersii]KAI5856767.1 glycoside hydrolase family 13 protein [Durotheca rogersii]